MSPKISPLHIYVLSTCAPLTWRYHILESSLIVQSPNLALKQLSHGVENIPETTQELDEVCLKTLINLDIVVVLTL